MVESDQGGANKTLLMRDREAIPSNMALVELEFDRNNSVCSLQGMYCYDITKYLKRCDLFIIYELLTSLNYLLSRSV